MKKFFALLLVMAMVFSLGACTAGNQENTVNPSDPAGAGASVSPTDTDQEPSLALPSEEPTPEPTAEPSQELPSAPDPDPDPDPTPDPVPDPVPDPTPDPVPDPTPDPTPDPVPDPTPDPTPDPVPDPTPDPVPDPTPNPTPDPVPDSEPDPTPPSGGIIIPGLGGLGGIGGLGGGSADPAPEPSTGVEETPVEPTGRTDADVDLGAFYESLLSSYDFPGMMSLATDDFVYFFPGLASIPAVQRVGSTTFIGNTTAEIVLVQATNLSDLTEIESIFEARKQTILYQQGNYLNVVDLWTENFRVVLHGNYIMMVVGEDCDAIVSDFLALF